MGQKVPMGLKLAKAGQSVSTRKLCQNHFFGEDSIDWLAPLTWCASFGGNPNCQS